MPRAAPVIATLAVIAAACGDATAPAPDPAPAPAPAPAPVPAPVAAAASNVTAADYVGPAVCATCHPDKAGRWRATLHTSMNQLAGPDATVIGDFDGARLAYAGGEARFEREGGVPVMILRAPDGAARRYRVTRTIGTRYLQEYVGTPLDGDAPGVELRLPFGWWRRRAGWYPQAYFDSWYGAEYDAAGRLAASPYAPDPAPWATRCAWCHNTYPFAIRARRDGVGHGFERWVEVDAATVAPATAAAIAADNLLPIDALVTVGISCESCHLGGRAHADDPERPPSFVPVGPQVRVRADAPDLAGGRANPRVVDAVCAQCHSTPSPRYPDGAPARNSTEALALAAGACASAIRCTDCHDPHERGPGAGAPDQARHLAACTRCHPALADPAAARAHAGPHGAEVTCLDCHMPRLVQGLDTHVRSHRISSPTDPAMLAAGAPNACNLCHLDRSIRWTVDALAAGWGVHLTPDRGWRRAYGDLDAAVGPIWLTRGPAMVRTTAAAAYARSRDRFALPPLIEGLDDPVAATRMWMLFAVEDLLGRRLTAAEYDPLAPPPVRAGQHVRLRAWAVREVSHP
ncbi:MAG TPA: ammonia-forming cytochrome c nitrite reductase subunit c552 [Kofleriaceae bacterium]|nr:ammonia-forming cytochrome c nitrite reductase subunit c552 [Kofleriaceae bacterium]